MDLTDGEGLSAAVVEDVRRRDQRPAPLLGLLAAPLLALFGAVIGALPIALVCGVGVLLLYPAHPKAGALEEYLAAHPRTRSCDVCVLVRDDHRPRTGVSYCARCDAWLCPECRGRYDLRAVAVLKAARSPALTTAPDNADGSR